MVHNSFHKALAIDSNLCKGCSHCIKTCPTEALRITDGKAMLYADWCIDCGRCYRACQNRAIKIVDDDIQQIYNYDYRVLLVPAVFYAQFEEKIPIENINHILGDLGFDEICTVEQSVDVLIDEINDYVSASTVKPVISSFCPAVIRLIQVRFPMFVDNIMRMMPPIEITAKYYREKYRINSGDSLSTGIFYLTPCIGKMAAIKSPVGGYKSPVNGVINMDYIYNKVLLAFKNKKYGDKPVKVNDEISSKGILWATTGGESSCIRGRALSIDGMSNVIEFLDKLENDEISDDIDYLELRGCDESCAGGILVQGNRFLIADYLKCKSLNYPSRHRLAENYKNTCSSKIGISRIEPKSMIKYDNDVEVALRKMEMAQQLIKLLPAIDCGACGAPSCEALAADISRGDATLSQCIFLQKKFENEGVINSAEGFSIMESIWGKTRFTNE